MGGCVKLKTVIVKQKTVTEIRWSSVCVTHLEQRVFILVVTMIITIMNWCGAKDSTNIYKNWWSCDQGLIQLLLTSYMELTVCVACLSVIKLCGLS